MAAGRAVKISPLVKVQMEIPTIDFSQLDHNHQLNELARACSEWGFFHLKNHGMPRTLRAGLLREAAAFFARPSESKHQVLRTRENSWGFYDRELTKNRRDWKEIFDVGREGGSDTPQWPKQQPSLKSAGEAFFESAEKIAWTLLRAIFRSLRADFSARRSDFLHHTSFLRLNFYPLCDDPAPASSETVPKSGRLGIGHHTDAGALTILLQDGNSGLQFLRDEVWYGIQGEPDDLIVNLGDVVQVYSNDRYRAPLHRVIASRNQERFSAPFFFNPALSARYEPLPELCADVPPHYRPIDWSEFRALRSSGDYANVGKEVQINDYRIG